jgi:hypothetical protein
LWHETFYKISKWLCGAANLQPATLQSCKLCLKKAGGTTDAAINLQQNLPARPAATPPNSDRNSRHITLVPRRPTQGLQAQHL